MPNDEHFTVRVDKDLARRVRAEAEKDRRTVSSLVRIVLADRYPAQPALEARQ
jgi:hypothetical protein